MIFFIGLQNYLCYANSVLYAQSNGEGIWSGLTITFLTVLLFFFGPSIAAYIPRCMAGTLLLHVGMDLLLEGVYDCKYFICIIFHKIQGNFFSCCLLYFIYSTSIWKIRRFRIYGYLGNHACNVHIWHVRSTSGWYYSGIIGICCPIYYASESSPGSNVCEDTEK